MITNNAPIGLFGMRRKTSSRKFKAQKGRLLKSGTESNILCDRNSKSSFY